MNFLENIELSITGLLLNKTRSLLTMLGIIIGISSVIAIFTIGNSFQGYMSSELQTMGAQNITVSVREKDSEVRTMGNPFNQASNLSGLDDHNKIQPFMVDALTLEYGESIYAISFNDSVGSGQTSIGTNDANVQIIGVNNDYLDINSIDLVEGRFFLENDQTLAKNLAIVSEKYVSDLELQAPYVGQTIQVLVNDRIIEYTILGVYSYEASTSASTVSEADVSTNIYIPLKTAQLQTGNTSYQSFTIVTETGVDSTDFATTVSTYMNNFYTKNTDYEISATSLESLAETMSSLLSTLELAISAIAALALLVGGIGVMNIMLVSITERTREIGTRKALGATNLSIQVQFITESAILTLIGGLIGVVFGLLLGLLGSSILGYPGSADWLDILLAVGTSILIGIFFGYYPSNKAAKLDPIEALRYE